MGSEAALGNPADTPSVLGKAFRIIDAFGSGELSLSLAEVSRRAGLPKSTAHRLVGQLEEWGVIERHRERLRLGLRLFEWGSLAPRQRTVRDTAVPYMTDLYEAARETVHLGLRERYEVVYVSKIAGRRQVRVPTAAGLRMPLHCTGLGKAILAFAPEETVEQVIGRGLPPRTPYTIVVPAVLRRELEAIRKRGVAYDNEESVIGVSCVAAPLFASDGSALGAISVTGASHRLVPERLESAVKMAGLTLSRELRGRT